MHALRREGIAEKRERLAAVEDPAIVFEAALRFLEPRQRSIGEVRRRLTRVGYREGLVEGAIVRLVELGMLDDGEFTAAWISLFRRSTIALGVFAETAMPFHELTS